MDFFFINVPIDQTIAVHDKEPPRISQRISDLSSQIDGVAMGSPLGPTLANIFSCHQETKYLKNCLTSFKPVYYKRYFDNIYLKNQDKFYHLLIFNQC